MPAYRTLLIANRGEIAVRIARSARALGLRTVAVYSEADADALHVRAADAAVCIGPAAAAASYLSGERLLAAARSTGADAVHPGYGFLAEHAAFAEACRAAGLVFVGPPAEAIRLMGDKRAAKQRMAAAGVPVIAGWHGTAEDAATLAREAARVGFPLMVKAAAGGGGHGMRRVESAEGLAEALRAARGEAEAAFGDGALMLERALDGARHVEVQVFADAHGNVVHLGERDCSVQRRHQKLIEEAPSPAVDAGLRERMGAAAVMAAREIGYEGAGTVEFLLDGAGAFAFLEMNTRLQVEHGVTECVTGLDLVAWQLRVAAGEPLPLHQAQIALRGHAIEARIYAEDDGPSFLPQTGRVLAWQPPAGEGVRVDHGLRVGMAIGAHYDGLLAKVIAWGDARETARQRLRAALEATVVLGVTANTRALAALLEQPTFADGLATTDWLDAPDTLAAVGKSTLPEDLWALGAVLLHGLVDHPPAHWRPAPLPVPLTVAYGDARRGAVVASLGAGRYAVAWGDRTRIVTARPQADGALRYGCDGVAGTAHAVRDGAQVWLWAAGHTARFHEPDARAAGREAAAGDGVAAPTGGRVLEVRVSPGDAVARGQAVIVLEAMKLQHELAAPRDGVVARVAVRPDDQVTPGQLLVELEAQVAPG